MMVCRVKGHEITIYWGWDWHQDIFGVRQRGKRIQKIRCMTCLLKKNGEQK